MFGLGRYQYDGTLVNNAGVVLPGSETDAFLGFGPGYRAINTPNQTWRVQGGPGARYYKGANGVSDTEAAFIVSSRYFVGLTDTINFTNDTDILGSKVNTVVSNDAICPPASATGQITTPTQQAAQNQLTTPLVCHL